MRRQRPPFLAAVVDAATYDRRLPAERGVLMSVIEIMTFELRPGVDQEEFLDADRLVQTEFVPTHGGFIRRTTARGDQGEWLVVTLWATPADAGASAARGVDDPVMSRFLATVEPTSMRTRRYATLD